MDRPRSDEARALTAVLCAAVLAGIGTTTLAESARELSWADLVPETVLEVQREAAEMSRRVEALTPEQTAAFRGVAVARTAQRRIDSGLVSEDELTLRERRALAAGWVERFPEVSALWADIERTRARLAERSAAVEPALDGARVRIPGYALPLQFDGTAVREFLLVPYVGACIHTPPPPRNQIVFVRPAEAFESEGLFSPVWVEGELSASGGRHELSFVDGQAPIDAGYSVEGAVVEPYER